MAELCKYRSVVGWEGSGKGFLQQYLISVALLDVVCFNQLTHYNISEALVTECR